jgi:hypothetical protein
MCGVTAVLSRHAPISPDTVRAGMASLHHRGPDGRRHWMAADGRVALGHTRLSIIDLVSGDQPIANEDETVHRRDPGNPDGPRGGPGDVVRGRGVHRPGRGARRAASRDDAARVRPSRTPASRRARHGPRQGLSCAPEAWFAQRRASQKSHASREGGGAVSRFAIPGAPGDARCRAPRARAVANGARVVATLRDPGARGPDGGMDCARVPAVIAVHAAHDPAGPPG